MAFTYSDALTSNRDKVRFRLGDTVEDAGPRPDKRNFSDAEIAFLLSDESSRVNGAIAAGFEVLANEWTAYAISESEGEASFNATQVAQEYTKRAAEYRSKPGGSEEADRSVNLITLGRTDAYS